MFQPQGGLYVIMHSTFKCIILLYIIQVTPIYIISFFFVIHIYSMPYEELFDNVLETIILLNYIILLCIRSCERILDQLDSYTGTMIPSNTGNEYPAGTNIILFFSFFLFTPIIITLVVYSGWIGIRLW